MCFCSYTKFQYYCRNKMKIEEKSVKNVKKDG